MRNARMTSTDMISDSQPPILTDIRETVGIITLNRPERLNAWTPEMATAYFDALEAFAQNENIRVILVNGSGRAFCAGADMGSLSDMAEGAPAPERDPRPYHLAMSIGKPVIAAIHGACYGVGVQQALCCDIRFVGHDLKLGTAYSQRGLVGELAISWNLSRLTGYGTALELLISGRTITAEEAVKLGLAHYISPTPSLFDDALNYCQTLAEKCSPWSMRMIKSQILHDLEATLAEAYTLSDTLLDQALVSADFSEGIAAFLEKRPVRFHGLPPSLATIPH